MRSSFTEHAHDASQRFVDSGTHVERFYREPSRVDPDHLMISRSNSAHSCAAAAGHSMITVPPRRRTLMRIMPSVFEGRITGTKPSSFIGAVGAVGRIAIGLPLRSACLNQRCRRLAFTPRANATAATDMPGCWHAPTASALKCALWLRLRRRLLPTKVPVVLTYTLISRAKRVPFHQKTFPAR